MKLDDKPQAAWSQNIINIKTMSTQTQNNKKDVLALLHKAFNVQLNSS